MARSEKEFVRNLLGMHRQMERLLNEAVRQGGPSSFGHVSWIPPADVFETRDGFLVRIEAAGLDPAGLRVTFEDGRLTVEGSRGDEECCERVACHQMEIPYGSFRRVFILTRDLDAGKAEAHYADGFLTIRLVRSDAGTRRNKIRIKVE